MTNDKKEKAIETIKKLYELYKRGVGGESSNAERLILKLKIRFNITDSDIFDDIIVENQYKGISNKDLEKIFLLTYLQVVGSSKDYAQNYVKMKSSILVKASDREHIDIDRNWRKLRASFQNEIKKSKKAVFRAFLTTNRLTEGLYKNEDKTEERDYKPLTKEEIEIIMMAQALAGEMTPTPLYKEIGK